MEFLVAHWGNLASVIGVIVSVGGLAWAVVEARGARSAAQSAEQAALETKDNIGRHLLAIDLERAINLIQRLKLLHSTGRWEAALEQYQALRAMLSDIIARYPNDESELSERLISARYLIQEIEGYVEAQNNRDFENEDVARLNQQLNKVQSDLEDMASRMGLGD